VCWTLRMSCTIMTHCCDVNCYQWLVRMTESRCGFLLSHSMEVLQHYHISDATTSNCAQSLIIIVQRFIVHLILTIIKLLLQDTGALHSTTVHEQSYVFMYCCTIDPTNCYNLQSKTISTVSDKTAESAQK